MEQPLDQAQQVKAFLYRKKRENGNERLRLAKAMQWYFFYGAMITTGIFLIHNYPAVLNIFSATDSYLIVIAFYILMYGIVFLAYMTTPWPYPLLFEKTSRVRAINWSVQLSWVERLMTIIYYTFFILGDLRTYVAKDYWGAIILFVFQLPHIITSLLGFPRRRATQVLCIVFRVLGLILSICHLHISFIFFQRFQTLAISGVLGALPFALIVGMYFNGRVDKRPVSFIFGKRRRDFTIMTVSGVSFFLWEGLLLAMVFWYNTSYYSFPNYFWTPMSSPFEDLVDFLEMCVVTCMAVLSIPTLYHSLLDISEVYPEKVYEESSENTRLLDMALPQSAPSNFMDQIALVIACHKSKDNIIKTLRAAHHDAHFPLKNIYVAHNAGTDYPIDETGPAVWASEEFKDVHYIYIPVGNKSVAMNYVIENYIKPDGIPMVVMIDDDVLFPSDIDLKGGYEEIANDEKVKAVAFTIRGIEDANFVQQFQHLEYMQAGLLKMFQGNFGSVMTCHGAIALWDVQACIDVFALHNTEFHGEDLQMGLILRKMNKEYRIVANAVGPVATASPKSLFYETDANEKSLFSQRVFSWDMAAHHFFLDFIQLTFVNWEKNGLILKPFLVIELWTMVQDWMRFLFLTSIFQQDPVKAISLIGVLIVLQMIVVLIFDKIILSHRPELQSSTYICLLYPIFNILTVMFRFVGLLYNALSYTPWNPPRILIKDRKRQGMIPPKVAEPTGTAAEREAYWNTVWKLATYTQNAEQPQVVEAQAVVDVPAVDAALAAAVSVAQEVLERQQSQIVDGSVVVDIDTAGEPGLDIIADGADFIRRSDHPMFKNSGSGILRSSGGSSFVKPSSSSNFNKSSDEIRYDQFIRSDSILDMNMTGKKKPPPSPANFKKAASAVSFYAANASGARPPLQPASMNKSGSSVLKKSVSAILEKSASAVFDKAGTAFNSVVTNTKSMIPPIQNIPCKTGDKQLTPRGESNKSDGPALQGELTPRGGSFKKPSAPPSPDIRTSGNRNTPEMSSKRVRWDNNSLVDVKLE